MAKWKVANSGSTWTDGRFVLEMEDRRISKELHSDEQSTDRRLSFIYNCLRYQQYKAAAQSALRLVVELE